ncbi:MAG: SAM-dependent methyltransferase [Desulfurococcaceae archaeon]|jgi:ubiquinone/menaquinone biosynthesis C-methylase UbiE|nr:MAG: SAM-dependent methyltransferase [Desulfurococcaceae archaeon]
MWIKIISRRYSLYLRGNDLVSYYEGIRVPWVPTREEFIEQALDLANVGKGDILYDLGCGDGRIVIAAAKRGARAVCVELNPELIKRAMTNAQAEGVDHMIKFVRDDIFRVNLSDATVVYMYLLRSVNDLLKPKLKAELKKGTRIISLDFEISGWKEVKTMRVSSPARIGTYYLYIIGLSDV